MIEATVYDLETGRILRTLTLLSGAELALNVGAGESALLGHADMRSQMVVDGAFVPRPPDPDAVWAALRAPTGRAGCAWRSSCRVTPSLKTWGQ